MITKAASYFSDTLDSLRGLSASDIYHGLGGHGDLSFSGVGDLTREQISKLDPAMQQYIREAMLDDAAFKAFRQKEYDAAVAARSKLIAEQDAIRKQIMSLERQAANQQGTFARQAFLDDLRMQDKAFDPRLEAAANDVTTKQQILNEANLGRGRTRGQGFIRTVGNLYNNYAGIGDTVVNTVRGINNATAERQAAAANKGIFGAIKRHPVIATGIGLGSAGLYGLHRMNKHDQQYNPVNYAQNYQNNPGYMMGGTGFAS